MSKNEVVGKSWTWTSLRARRHHVLLNLDREWCHVMAYRLLNTIASKFLSESCACNLRSETWRRWLSACLRTHLTCAPSRNNFEGTFAGNGKKRVLFCADKTPRLNFNRVRVRAPCANSLIFKRLVKNNYVTPASSCP